LVVMELSGWVKRALRCSLSTDHRWALSLGSTACTL
jgi:hypothetical protein